MHACARVTMAGARTHVHGHACTCADTHARSHARTLARWHARTLARPHARTLPTFKSGYIVIGLCSISACFSKFNIQGITTVLKKGNTKLKACAQRFRYALFAFIHTQTYFEYYTLTLRLASLVKKAVIYAYWTKELFDICRENVSHGDATLGC